MRGFPGAWCKRSLNTASDAVDLVKVGQKWKSKVLSGVPQPAAEGTRPHMYVLSMFPYPSGMLHIGHLRVYTISDALNRFYRMKGYEVVHPMGWDAFGLPAENAALERGIAPADWTRQNIARMKQQKGDMLAHFEWGREVTTCDPEYYRFTQELFLELWHHGMAYKKEAEINWDPVDKTVLANEQVDAQGRSWRSGALVEKRKLNQWFLRITRFAHELSHDLDGLDGWPAKVKAMQKHWIGEVEGTEVRLCTGDGEAIVAFTPRIEAVFGLQYVAISTEHALTKKMAERLPELCEFLQRPLVLSESDLSGFQLPGTYVQHPFAKDHGHRIPVFVSPYVPADGAGAVLGTPAHDEFDHKFWRANKPAEPVISSFEASGECDDECHIQTKGILNAKAGNLKGISSQDAKQVLADKLVATGDGRQTTQYRLRDWLISRQRYWGAPIPIIYCDSCGTVPVPKQDLPVMLPNIAGLSKKGNTLEHIPEFVNTSCPSCGGPAKRETDTMDTFMDSSWYFFRYLDSHNQKEPFGYDKATRSMPVDMYIGGVEHSILHLLYARFISKFLASIGKWDGSACNGEPFKRLVTQGMVHGKTFIDPENGSFLKPEELDMSNPADPIICRTGQKPRVSYEKMSKSKYNGADPAQCISKHGPDAIRAHILFQAPISDVVNWDETKIVGIERWLARIIKLAHTLAADSQLKHGPVAKLTNMHEIALFNEVQKLLGSITDSFSRTLSLNTVISDYMKLTNLLDQALKNKDINPAWLLTHFKKLVSVIHPTVPAVSEEAADIIKGHLQLLTWDHYVWPTVDAQQKDNSVGYRVFVDGKMRFIYPAPSAFINDKNGVLKALLAHPDGGKYLAGRQVKNLILKKNIISLVLQK
ncbi:AER043Cp [Eremothecium gossypii ATCC 10895]|uniref:Leucine--tRNA ligase, mitochondrial n=1 Tax=Eremothecium gossypii (strain ATCC 10895 / CBS 109.51 / FGSC 9923 / NRRL Y-1056) TaxID=284811 RepID=Q757H0_EREGS|nr:AER043Cp [Eremothecium gossypii ATCC 10895]AAS52727.1 AER043Cp [Eremothecium gossypii ATCC 10895]AEY97033.1 FAER043Cp [Eremothecium gossypii FDAG1]